MAKILPRISIKVKLFLLIIIPFSIPIMGYFYINNMNEIIQQREEDLAKYLVKTTASLLENNPDNFPKHSHFDKNNLLYIRGINNEILLDGYAEEWGSVSNFKEKFYDKKDDAKSVKQQIEVSKNFYYLSSHKDNYVYIFIKAKKDNVNYCKNADHLSSVCDKVIIKLSDIENTNISSYLISTNAPGKTLAKQIIAENGNNKTIQEQRIIAEFQQSDTGFNLEIRISKGILKDKLSIEIFDASNPNIKISSSDNNQMNHIFMASKNISNTLNSIQQKGIRTWIIDKNGIVIASSDKIKEINSQAQDESISEIISGIIFRLIVDEPTIEFYDKYKGAATLENNISKSALKGQSNISWYTTPDGNAKILIAGSPISIGKKIIGAVILERSNLELSFIKNKAIKNIINLTIIFFILTIIIITFFAARFSNRLLKLKYQSKRSITSDGRINSDHKFKQISGSDEISDLSNTINTLINKIASYNDYLETIAGKLSHELKTPLAIISSSIESIDIDTLSNDDNKYLLRAQEGANRLKLMLSAMSEATRLEQSFSTYDKENFSLSDFIGLYIDGFSKAYGFLDIDYQSSTDGSNIIGNKELIAQLLDKLLSNARDFHTPNTTIFVRLSKTQDDKNKIDIINSGPSIPENILDNIFNPMVTSRMISSKTVSSKTISSKTVSSKEPPSNISKDNNAAHMGLGLYIVKLISEFHNGRVEAKNLSDGVNISVIL